MMESAILSKGPGFSTEITFTGWPFVLVEGPVASVHYCGSNTGSAREACMKDGQKVGVFIE